MGGQSSPVDGGEAALLGNDASFAASFLGGVGGDDEDMDEELRLALEMSLADTGAAPSVVDAEPVTAGPTSTAANAAAAGQSTAADAGSQSTTSASHSEPSSDASHEQQ